MKNINEVDKNFEIKENKNILKYYNVTNLDKFCVYGLNWFKKDLKYSRFSDEDKPSLEKYGDGLMTLVDNTSGGQIAFYSDTDVIELNVKLKFKFAMSHMAYTGQSGFDLYQGDNIENIKFVKTTNFPINVMEYKFTFVTNTNDLKLYVLNMPLYASVDSVEIGINENAKISAANNLYNKRCAIFGTSITQGGCASRPGMSFTNILSRKQQTEYLNYGFSGNGKGQIEIANIINKLENIDFYILDYDANCDYDLMVATLENFTTVMMKDHLAKPIIVISKIFRVCEDDEKTYEFQKQFVIDNKDKYNIHFIDGITLIDGLLEDGTVDKVHPTDLGFYAIALNLHDYLKEIIKF